MNALRTLSISLLTIVLAVVALPASAAVKAFQIVNQSTPVEFTTQSIDVDFKNVGDNSSFNSLTLKGTAAGATLTISNAMATSGKRGTFAKISNDEIRLTDLSPTKVGDSLKVRLTVVLAVSTTNNCAAGTITWTGTAWTGSPTDPSNQFAPTGAAPVTDINKPTCSMTFDKQPATAIKDQFITNAEYDPAGTPVKVKLTVNGAPSAGKTVYLDSIANCGISGSLSLAGGTNTLTDANGIAAFPALKSSTIGSGCKLTARWSALPASVTATSDAFKVTTADLKFTSLPKSVVPGTPSSIAVKLIDLDDAAVTTFGGSISLSVVVEPGSTCTLPSTNISAVSGEAVGTITFGGTPGVCRIKAKTTFNGVDYEITSTSFKVFEKSGLFCSNSSSPDPNDPANAAAQFSASPTGVTSDDQAAYAAGIRGPNKDGSDCVVVNWTWLNNVKGTNDATDQNGNAVPKNGVSFSWDLTSQPKAAFLYTVTWKSQWVTYNAITGLPSGVTKYCTDQGCINRAVVKNCLGTLIEAASMPAGEKACIVREVRVVVPNFDTEEYCTGTPPSSGAACQQVSTTFIDIDDPVLIRD